jgi:hypothetical protein
METDNINSYKYEMLLSNYMAGAPLLDDEIPKLVEYYQALIKLLDIAGLVFKPTRDYAAVDLSILQRMHAKRVANN